MAIHLSLETSTRTTTADVVQEKFVSSNIDDGKANKSLSTKLHFPKKPPIATLLELLWVESGSPVMIVFFHDNGHEQESQGWPLVNFPLTFRNGSRNFLVPFTNASRHACCPCSWAACSRADDAPSPVGCAAPTSGLTSERITTSWAASVGWS